jgi:hypothetical protein
VQDFVPALDICKLPASESEKRGVAVTTTQSLIVNEEHAAALK